MKKNEKKDDIKMEALKKFIDMDRKSINEVDYGSNVEIDSNNHTGKLSYYKNGLLETRYYKICGNNIYKAKGKLGGEISPYICQGEYTIVANLENDKKEIDWMGYAIKGMACIIALCAVVLGYVWCRHKQQPIEDIEKETNIDEDITIYEEEDIIASTSGQIIEQTKNPITINSLENELSNANYSDVDLESLIAYQNFLTQGYTLESQAEIFDDGLNLEYGNPRKLIKK